MNKKAVVLLSGGLDSTTCLAIAKAEGFDCHALSFSYGQRHNVELEAAKHVAKQFGVDHHLVIRFDMTLIGGSALTAAIDVPKDRAIDDSIPPTYVPARNTIFLSFALAYAETLQAEHIFIGVNALDYSGYPDCRPEYLAAFAQLAQLATVAGVEGKSTMTFHAPLVHMTKAEIIRKGLDLGVDYGITHSCYAPEGYRACGRCDSCQLRLKGFALNGVADPARYVLEAV